MESIKLITYKIETPTFLDRIVSEFEEAILKSNKLIPIYKHKSAIKIYKAIFYFLYKTRIKLPSFLKNDKIYFSIGMGPDFSKMLPYSFLSKNNNIFLFDSWPQYHSKIENSIKLFDVKNVFFTSEEVCQIFKKKQGICNFHFIPEAINPNEYKYIPYKNRTIDVLQIGRKYDLYHDKIKGYLESKKLVYLYEKVKGEIIFPDHISFINGLANSKISICVPSNITHPERSGQISTMTVRYLQSMASKCLIVGILPKEMEDLFDYNPIIAIDMNDPCGQISKILDNYEKYIPLIEKNYIEVIKNHNWGKRWQEIEKLLLI